LNGTDMNNTIRHDNDSTDSPINGHASQIPEPESFPRREDTSREADSFENETRSQLNQLRERTFNPELRKLVDRIRINEPGPGKQDETPEIDTLPDEELLLNLYRLFYKARNISDNNEINISFDPFKIPGDSLPADTRESLARQLNGLMRHLSLSPFALLSYDMSARGYVPFIHDFEGTGVENIIISLRDGLFHRILTARDGILVDSGSVRDDHYLSKIFSMSTDKGGALYFIMINNVISDIVKELASDGAPVPSSYFPSALLMIMIPEDQVKNETADLARTVRERLSLPLYLLNDNHSLVYSLERYDDLSYTFDVLDYFFNLFLLKKDMVGMTLHASVSSGTSMPFIMKYIISKLNSKLFSDSVIINVLKERLIILTEQSHVPIIKQIFEEYNILFKDSFTINEFRSSEFNDSHEVIQKIIIDY
jgi:hypothetical protein